MIAKMTERSLVGTDGSRRPGTRSLRSPIPMFSDKASSAHQASLCKQAGYTTGSNSDDSGRMEVYFLLVDLPQQGARQARLQRPPARLLKIRHARCLRPARLCSLLRTFLQVPSALSPQFEHGGELQSDNTETCASQLCCTPKLLLSRRRGLRMRGSACSCNMTGS